MTRPIFGLLVYLLLVPVAQPQDVELLDPDKAFAFSAQPLAPDRIQLTWDIAKDYYMYRDKFRVQLVAGEVILEALQIPPGKLKTDAFFGEVEIYTDRVQIDVPVIRTAASPTSIVIEAHGQGCNEPVGVCYPPMKHSATLQLAAITTTPPAADPAPAAATGSVAATKPASLNSLKSLRDLLGAGNLNDEFLDPDEAFKLQLAAHDSNTLSAQFSIADGYYLYQDKVKFSSGSPVVRVGDYRLPPGTEKEDEFFGKIIAYYQGFEVAVPLLRAIPDALSVPVKVGYQGCADKGICYPPIEKTIDVSLPAASALIPGTVGRLDPTPVIEAVEKGFWGYILTAFFTGILLTFTPCVLPMIPILSSIIVGQGEGITRGRGGLLAGTYVLGTAVTYTAAGILAGASGDQLQAYFQNIWAIGAVSVLLALLALSMFGLYEIQMPSFIQSRLQTRTQAMQGGTLGVVFVLGVISALIVGACVSPLLIVALGVAIVNADPVLGGAIMFAMAWGMGTFLIVLGLGAGFLLPKAGRWMDTVKHAFGVLLLAVAVYLLGVIPEVPVLYLWGGLLIVTAVYMGATQALPEEASGWRFLWKGVGVFMLIWGVLALLGGMAGQRDILRPLLLGPLGFGGQSVNVESGGPVEHLFTRVNSLQQLDDQLARAKQNSQPVMLDYYADWCVDCVRMEQGTFRQPEVNRVLRDRFVLLQVDVTDPNDANTKAIKRRYGVFGPPALLFFAADGRERQDLRRYGYMPPGEFLDHIARI